MAMGLSIGDIIALTQLCYKAGTALLGTVEAPEEFRRAQVTLHAIGEALKSLDTEIKKPGSVFEREDRIEPLEQLIYNCGGTLRRFEALVTRYGQALGSDSSVRKGLIEKINEGRQRVMWIKDKQEVETLAEELSVHLSALTLVTTTTNSAALAGIAIDIKKILKQCHHQYTGKSEPAETLRVTNIVKKTVHPDGLPFVSTERCQRIDTGHFEFQIFKETEDGKALICPSAQLRGSHFLAPTSPGKAREELFQCNCRQWFGGSGSNSSHAWRLNKYSCGQKTFIAQSFFEADGGKGWWLLQTSVKKGTGAYMNLFLELKDPEKRPWFARIVASMLRTNVARNVLLGIIPPFDLVRPARNGPKPHERLQVAWSYDERNVRKRGKSLQIGTTPWQQVIEFSDVDYTQLSAETVQSYFSTNYPPVFSWYRVAMFESIDRGGFMEDTSVEDAHFFLDHFHTSAEIRVELSDPLNPNTSFWGNGEFGGADLTFSPHTDDGSKELADELMFTVSRFTIQKENKNWPSPWSVDCSLNFTFHHGYSELVSTLYTMWKRYESLSNLAGSAAEFSQAKFEVPTKDTPRFLMQTQSAVFTEFYETAPLDLCKFNTARTFHSCWLLGRKGYDQQSPLNFMIKSITQDIHCHVYLSENDARGLRRSANILDRSLSFKLAESAPSGHADAKKSCGRIYPRNPYGPSAPPGVNICGTLKLSFSSELDLNFFLQSMESLFDIAEKAIDEYTAPRPYERETIPDDNKISQPETVMHTAPRQSATRQLCPDENRPHSAEGLIPVMSEQVYMHIPDGKMYYQDPYAVLGVSDLPRRSKTLPSSPDLPPAFRDRHAFWAEGPQDRHTSWTEESQDRHTSWPGESQPGLERATTFPRLAPASTLSSRLNDMHITPKNHWNPTSDRHYHPPPLAPQWPPSSVPEHGPYPRTPALDWTQLVSAPGPYIMPDVSHFTNYTAVMDNRTAWQGTQGYTEWNSTGDGDYNQVPRTWAKPPTENRGFSSPQSLPSMFPRDFDSHDPTTVNMPLTPHLPFTHPQQQQRQEFSNRTESKRCMAISGFQGSPIQGQVSLKVGQVYDVVSQADSSWVWVQAQPPLGPSGYAPATYFREY